MVAPLTVLIGRVSKSLMAGGLALIPTWYSNWPILAVPDGKIRFCAFTALMTSAGGNPRACLAWEFRFPSTYRSLPPYGDGTTAPGTVISCGRTKLVA